jgi:hypothetical protein
MHSINLSFRATFCNGWPSIKILVDDALVTEHYFSTETHEISVPIPPLSSNLKILRFGKTENNMIYNSQTDTIEQDQILEITSIKYKTTAIPVYVLNKFSAFTFADQVHAGSMFFGPNGTWEFKFSQPLVTWLLDEKITHEAQYTQEFKYDWAYKLGPGHADKILSEIQITKDKVLATKGLV